MYPESDNNPFVALVHLSAAVRPSLLSVEHTLRAHAAVAGRWPEMYICAVYLHWMAIVQCIVLGN